MTGPRAPQARRAPAARPVTPRDAASLVLLRRTGKGAEVLIGRRAAKHRFMPDVFVFPGGRLDAIDLTTEVGRDLAPDVAARLQRKWSPRKSRGLAVAAVRETHEETGLTIGDLDRGRLRPDLGALDYVARAITPPDSPIRFHARFFCIDAEHAGGDISDSHELLDLQWQPIAAALKMPIVDVTEFVLQEIQRREAGDRPAGVPLFSYRHGRARILYED